MQGLVGGRPARGHSRQDGRQGQHLRREVGQVGEDKHKARLDDAHMLGEACHQGEQEGEHDTCRQLVLDHLSDGGRPESDNNKTNSSNNS